VLIARRHGFQLVTDDGEYGFDAPKHIVASVSPEETTLRRDAVEVLETIATADRHTLDLTILVTPEAVYCAECGRKFKSIRRHLLTEHGLLPDAYREKWGLGKDFPMVAPNYSAVRSGIAKSKVSV
jgi:predicted transcriptional regulator